MRFRIFLGLNLISLSLNLKVTLFLIISKVSNFNGPLVVILGTVIIFYELKVEVSQTHVNPNIVFSDEPINDSTTIQRWFWKYRFDQGRFNKIKTPLWILMPISA